MNKIKRRFGPLFELVLRYVRNIEDNHVFAYATQASFFVIVSAAPFLIFLINIFQVLLPDDMGYLLSVAKDVLPYQLEGFATDMIRDFYVNVSIPLVSATSIFMIWSASRGLRAISKGLRMVFEENEDISVLKTAVLPFIYTILFMVGIIVSILLLVFGNYFAEFLIRYNPYLEGALNVIIRFRYIGFLVYLTAFFLTTYRFLGNSKMKFKAQLPGALLAAGCWLVFTRLYSFYIQNLTNFSVIYGSLAAIMFLMLWLWFCMIFLLLGAQINVWLQRIRTKGFAKKRKVIKELLNMNKNDG